MNAQSDIAAAPCVVAAFYRFAPVAAPAALGDRLRARGQALDLCGSIIVAPEGLNGTIAGARTALEQLFAEIALEPGFADLRVRYHESPERPFLRWKVKVKREIVTMGVPGVDPNRAVGHYVPPAQWDALLADPDTILIDTRNDYEVAIGTFNGALDPEIANFSQFPAWFDAQAAQWRAEGRQPKIAMFCTGGIRCEKSTALARSRGFEEVYHLEGGILAYLAQVGETESSWRGDCFLFDDRVSITHGERQGATRARCPRCGQPHGADASVECGACGQS